MPIYEYEHTEEPCELGKVFDIEQSYKDERLSLCPQCGRPIVRLISRTFVSTPKTNSELKDMGFTKLVKRDTGVYENVTRRGNESKFMEAGKKETVPDIKKIISD